MSASVKQWIAPDAAAPDLWRVAETGDVEELARILPRVGDVNARNQHGMTALMRAAYHGHERMVRALLKHGADPNSTRNDKFTALALAAFFGHTGTVRILLEHGAKTEIVTRCGTSPRMWATARTFEEAARCFERETPAPAPAAAPVPAPSLNQPLVVKTLKDPPEIWDLVHEVPRGFNARSAFVSRLQSMKTSLAFRAAAILLVSTACIIGALMLRGSQARSLPPTPSPDHSATGSKVGAPQSVEDRATSVSTSEVDAPAAEAVINHHAAELSDVNSKRNGSRKPSSLTRQNRSQASVDEDVVENVQGRGVAVPSPPLVATPQFETPKSSESAAKNKAGPSLSPQLIAPAKSATPPAKVIQWP